MSFKIFNRTRLEFTFNRTSDIDSKLLKVIGQGIDSTVQKDDYSLTEDLLLTYNGDHPDCARVWYAKDTIRFPKSLVLPVYETQDSRAYPRAIATIDKVIIAWCKDLKFEGELEKAGFESQEDFMYQFTEMENRYYPNCTPESWVSFFHYSEVDMNPDKDKVKQILEK